MLYGTPNRQAAWDGLTAPWDMIVVGGGITGAGIMREAARLGLRVLLLEQNDFASGTSSRSSKMVHGGLRYIKNLQMKLVWQSVHEREALLADGPGLIEPLPFLTLLSDDMKLPAWVTDAALRLYGWMGGKWHAHQDYDPHELPLMIPGISINHLTGGFGFYDAQTDDARLVVRVIREGVQTGLALALNYARVETLLRDETGQVTGVTVRDQETDHLYTVHTRVIVNATGAWSDQLRQQIGAAPCIRPLRGSHLLFARDRFPLYQAVSFPHPQDGRSIIVIPWEGVTLLGTTDLDHDQDLDSEPAISPEEITYLLAAAHYYFPALELTEADVKATFAGVRPVISHNPTDPPSKESREHAIWYEQGLLTITGGKLTTFRQMALDALNALSEQFPQLDPDPKQSSTLNALPELPVLPLWLPQDDTLRLAARYGPDILDLAATVPENERGQVPDTSIYWFEFRWAARHEAVNHLTDLLLRRVRVGLLTPHGGEPLLPTIRPLVQAELGWDNKRWQEETAVYLAHWRTHYGTPAHIRAQPRPAA